MAETSEPGSDSRDDDGGDRSRRLTARARRWWEQPWLWLVVIVVVIGGALGISYAVSSDPDDIAPQGDTTAFCASIDSYRQVRDSPENQAGGPGADEKLRAAFGGLQQVAPSEIKPTTDEIARTLDRVIEVERSTTAASNGLDAAATADSQLTSIEQQVERASMRFTNYVRRACGVDLDVTPPPTVPEAPSGSTVLTPIPSDRATLVTPG